MYINNVFIKVEIVVLSVVLSHFMVVFSWNYKEQDKWPGICTTGKYQSPINIQKSKLLQKNCVSDLNFKDWEKPTPATATNDGHTVTVTITGSVKPTLSGGELVGTYNFDNFHYHWPAEHTVDGQSFDLEAHVVFYSSKFPNLTSAIQVKDSVAVIGVLFNKIDTKGPAIFDTLASAAQQVSKKVGTSVQTGPIVLKDILPTSKHSFYYYKGSLTTPDCNEGVSWNILTNPGGINREQYKSLTTIYGSDNQLLTFTNRKLKPLNGRPLYVKQ